MRTGLCWAALLSSLSFASTVADAGEPRAFSVRVTDAFAPFASGAGIVCRGGPDDGPGGGPRGAGLDQGRTAGRCPEQPPFAAAFAAIDARPDDGPFAEWAPSQQDAAEAAPHGGGFLGAVQPADVIAPMFEIASDGFSADLDPPDALVTEDAREPDPIDDAPTVGAGRDAADAGAPYAVGAVTDAPSVPTMEGAGPAPGSPPAADDPTASWRIRGSDATAQLAAPRSERPTPPALSSPPVTFPPAVSRPPDAGRAADARRGATAKRPRRGGPGARAARVPGVDRTPPRIVPVAARPRSVAQAAPQPETRGGQRPRARSFSPKMSSAGPPQLAAP